MRSTGPQFARCRHEPIGITRALKRAAPIALIIILLATVALEIYLLVELAVLVQFAEAILRILTYA